MNLLFSMSLAGSMILLIYLVIRPVAIRYFPAAWRYRFLKVNLLIFLLPYQYYKYTYMEILGKLFAKQEKSAAPSYSAIRTYNTIYIDSEGGVHFENQSVIISALVLWGLITLAFLLYHLISYILCIRNLRQVAKSSVSATLEAVLHTSTKFAEAKIPVYTSRLIAMPFTIGFFNPRILLPDSLSDQTTLRMVVSHELEHVRNRDNFIKLLCLLVLLLHCYNPLVYLLYWEICKVSEQVCDSVAIKDMPEREIEKYQLLILEMSQKAPKINALLASPLSGRFKAIRERIIVMSQTPVSPRKTRIASLVLAVLILALSPISVFAYATPAIIDPVDQIIYENRDHMYFKASSSSSSSTFLSDPFREYGTAHDLFVDTDGNIYILPDTNISSTCSHIWEDGEVYIHNEKDNGGCTVYIYLAQRCKKCQCVRHLVYDHETTYRKCPH